MVSTHGGLSFDRVEDPVLTNFAEIADAVGDKIDVILRRRHQPAAPTSLKPFSRGREGVFREGDFNCKASKGRGSTRRLKGA